MIPLSIPTAPQLKRLTTELFCCTLTGTLFWIVQVEQNGKQVKRKQNEDRSATTQHSKK